MRKLFLHPVPVFVLVLLLSVTVRSTSPIGEASDAPGVAAATIGSAGDGIQEGPCNLTCGYDGCPFFFHWAGREGDKNRWDGGDHEWVCWPKPCGFPPLGKHAPCSPGEAMVELDEAVVQGEADRLAGILADYEAFVLNAERRAIQVWSTCTEGELSAHVPLSSDLFDALVLVQDQDALE